MTVFSKAEGSYIPGPGWARARGEGPRMFALCRTEFTCAVLEFALPLPSGERAAETMGASGLTASLRSLALRLRSGQAKQGVSKGAALSTTASQHRHYVKAAIRERFLLGSTPPLELQLGSFCIVSRSKGLMPH
jgi:hypothetical protein